MCEIFISYCHENENFFNRYFLEMFKDLEENYNINFFYDRKIPPGKDYKKEIYKHIDSCSFAIMMLSESFYESKACLDEKEKLLARRDNEGLPLHCIVISDCNWKNDTTIAKYLMLNKDGRPLLELGEVDIYEEIKIIKRNIIQQSKEIDIISNLKFQDDFRDLLEDVDIFKRSHKSKNSLKLSDIFVYPELKYYENKKKNI